MLQIFVNANYDFVGRRRWFYLVSGGFMLLSIASIVFRGGLNYYRNIHRNWETTPQLANAQIALPVLFVAGEKDLVLRGATAEQLTATMSKFVRDLRGVKLYPGVGHWVQQERPDEVNKAVIEFLKSLPTS